jgi:hypothetical protein
LRKPGGALLEILGVGGDFQHERVDAVVGDGNEALGTAFGAARVAIDFDEAVVEVDGGVVLDPVDAEANPILRVAGLIEADQVADGFGLGGLGEGGGFFEIRIGFTGL